MAVRNEDTDVNDMLNTASIEVSAATGSTKNDKKQTQINIERLTHIRALEKSISKGGVLREMYDATLKTHKDGVENLMTNEDAAKGAMYSKRRKRIPSLLLSWLVMHLYVILRTFDMFFDGGIISAKMGYQGLALGPKVGSNHPFLGRISIPIVVATFISFVSAITKYSAGMLDYVREGDTIYIHDFSRLARSTKDLLSIVEKLKAKDVHIVSNEENIDSSTPTGKLMLTMIGAIAEFERQNMLERQAEGIAIAKREGKFKGGQVKKIDNKTWEQCYNQYMRREMG